MEYVFVLNILNEEGYRCLIPTTTQQSLILALDVEGVRPRRLSFKNDDDLYPHTTFINATYEVQGSDDLRIQANCIRFFRDTIEPCVQRCLDSLYGRKKFSVQLVGESIPVKKS